MRRVRRHIRTGVEAGRDAAELADEAIRTYDLTSVEAGLARTMAGQQARGGRNRPRSREASESNG